MKENEMKTIKTWQERLDTDKWPNVAMQAEIDELRAELGTMPADRD